MTRAIKIVCGLWVIVVFGAGFLPAKEKVPTGVLVASIGETVVLFDPASSKSTTINSGPVGWLFPAPGGTLFAPDLVNGKTSVIDLRRRRRVEIIDGVTMPHFGEARDRYFSIGESVLLVSYPDRALLARVDVTIENPWQVIVPRDGSVLIVLCRRPDGEGGVRLAALDMHHRKLSYDSPIPGDITRIELIKSLGLVAMTDVSSRRVQLVSPGSLTLAASFPVAGPPVDLVAFGEGGRLAVVSSSFEGVGPQLLLWKIKTKKKKLTITKEHRVALPADPVGVAISPSEQWLAVAMADSQIVVIDIKEREIISTISGPGVARDFIWSDPGADGPVLERWSDTEKEPIELELESWVETPPEM